MGAVVYGALALFSVCSQHSGWYLRNSPGRGDLAPPAALINSSCLSEVIESNAFRHINRAAGRKVRKLGKKQTN